MEIELIRDADLFAAHNFGKMWINDKYFGETLEDKDGHLENGGVKEYGNTAIPRGRYRVSMYLSPKYGIKLPLLHDVPGYTGVEIHGGNTESDTLGCILLGAVRTGVGIANCKSINQRLRDLLTLAEIGGEESWITIT